MILVESLLYTIDQKLNKLSSNAHQSIQLEDKILALNENQIKLIKQKLDGNPSRLGLDGNKKRYEDLQRLVENPQDHMLPLVLSDISLNQYSADVSSLSPGYMFYIDSYMIADKGPCKDQVIFVDHDLTKHSDITTLIRNSNYKPSFEFRETFCAVSSDEIWVYTDGSFTPKHLNLSYLRYPLYIDYPGYVKFDGTDSILQNCELKNYLQDELVDLTVQSLAMYTENKSAVETSQMRISTNS